ncbi:MAG: chemotaxis protein CheX [Nitrospirota bacterium]
MTRPPSPQLTLEHFHAFIEPAIHVIEKMVGLSVRAGVPRVGTSVPQEETVTVMIGLRGDLTGTIVFRFRTDLVRRIVKGLTGDEETIDEIDGAAQDALGELANVIAGNATGNLQRLGLQVTVTLPVIAMGRDFRLVFPDIPELVVIPLETAHGDIEMSVTFAAKVNGDNAP